MTYSHLSENAQSMADAQDDERIRYINQRVFIPYQRARELLDEMEDLLVHPKTNRMPNLLIVARPNNGKTEIHSNHQSQMTCLKYYISLAIRQG
ncbi:MAG: TniB family NTP-binding protein, partial [Candidatus Thiodiazotropha endolucinida]